MPANYAENAVMAKVKALYGRRLTPEQYRQLLGKKSVGEVATYLQQETPYIRTLREARAELLHRGQLENMVHRYTVEVYGDLIRYTFSDRFFLKMYAMQSEIDQLMAALRMLNSQEMDHFILSFPPYLNKYLTFDLFALAKIRSFDDLLAVVAHSDYHGLLGVFRPIADGRIDINGCERTLLTHYYRRIFALAEKSYGGEARRDLLSILHIHVDIHNIQVIYRLKRFFGYTPAQIREYLLPVQGHLTPAQLGHLIEADSADQVLDVLRGMRRFRRFFADSGDDELQHMVRAQRKHICQKIFRFSIHPVVVLLSYSALLELEADNLINIIEGIRYKLPAEEIRSMLIL